MTEIIDVEDWLAKNTGWCQDFQAWITPAQCRENRKKAKFIGEIEPKYKYCLNCPGVQKAGQTSKDKKQKATKRKFNQRIYCLKCGRGVQNHGRGLCTRCYKEADLDGTLEIYKLKNAEAAEEKTETKTTQTTETVSLKESKKDPLAQAKQVVFRAEKNTRSVGAKRIIGAPKIRLHTNLQRLEFNSYVIEKFGLDKYKYVKFYKKDDNIYILLQNYLDDSNTLRLTWKDGKKKSSIIICCTKAAQKIGWTGGELFEAKATSREDVIKLEGE